MPIVVSDTSPLRALQHLNRLDLLERLYGRVYIPSAVVLESQRTTRLFPALNVAAYTFLHVEDPTNQAQVTQLESSLDAGEAAALALALEKKADFVLMDESDGRRVARSLGLQVVGVLGILAQAKHAGLVPAVKPLIDQLVAEIEFHVSPVLIAELLRRVNE